MPDMYLRGEGGSIIGMDLPLAEGIADRLTKGYLKRVNADGSPYVEPSARDATTGGSDLTSGRTPRPAQSATKAEWVGYAVHAVGMSPDDAEAMTKQDLIDLLGKD